MADSWFEQLNAILATIPLACGDEINATPEQQSVRDSDQHTEDRDHARS